MIPNPILPAPVIETINKLELTGNPYAAFDLDNTLLVGDVGEAVFVSLIKKGLIQGFGWQDYLNLLSLNREAAYVKVVEIMDGLELGSLEKITYEVLKSDQSHIDIDGDRILYPRPNKIMQALIFYLKAIGIDVFVVTASNQVSAAIVCLEYFNIPASNVFGVPVGYDSNGRLAYKPSAIPYGNGKVNVLKSKFSNKPVVTGGDGIWDTYLLDYTSDNGVRLWLGHDDQEYQKLKEELYADKNFYHIQYQKDMTEK